MMRRRNRPVTQPGSGVEIASDCTHQQWDLSSWKCDYSRAVPGKRGPECAAVDSSEVPLLINSGTAALLVFDQALDTSRTGSGLDGGLVGPLTGADAPPPTPQSLTSAPHMPPPVFAPQEPVSCPPVPCWTCSGPVLQAPHLLLTHQP